MAVRVALLLTLVGSCEAYSMLSMTRMRTHTANSRSMLSMQTDQWEFRYGSSQRAVGTGGGTRAGLAPEPNGQQQIFNSKGDAFRYGAAQQVVGVAGGIEAGINVPQGGHFPTQDRGMDDNDEWDFRYGSYQRAVGVGGGIQAGLAPEPCGIEQSFDNKADAFRHGAAQQCVGVAGGIRAGIANNQNAGRMGPH